MKKSPDPQISLYSQGGKARAAKLSKEERTAIAAKGAAARWSKDIPQATYEGDLEFGGVKFKAAVIEQENGPPLRLISQGDFMTAMGMYYSGYIAKQHREQDTSAGLPIFLAQTNLKPFIQNNLKVLQFTPVPYRTQGGAVAKGIPSNIITKICEVWLDADKAGVLKPRQKIIAKNAETIHRGIAEVGMIALVDEATGYQTVRSRDALQVILDAFLRKEFAAWAKRFPDEFYREIYRLRGWKWSDTAKNKIQYVGKLTKDVIYQRLAPGVAEDLEKKNPKTSKGHRTTKHHQWLTDDVGHPALAQHLHAVIGFMRASRSWDEFYGLIDRAFPKRGQSVQFELPLVAGDSQILTGADVLD